MSSIKFIYLINPLHAKSSYLNFHPQFQVGDKYLYLISLKPKMSKHLFRSQKTVI